MKFAQLAEYSVKNAENEEWRLVTDLSFFFFFKKALNELKPSYQHLNFNLFC